MLHRLSSCFLFSALLLVALPACSEEQPLKLELAISNPEPLLMENVYATITLTNVSDEPILVPTRLHLCGMSELRVDVMFEGELLRRHGEICCGAVSEPFFLNSGESLYTRESLKFNFGLKGIGHYRITAHYDAGSKTYIYKDSPLPSTSGKIESKTLTLKVRQPQGLDKAAYEYLFLKHKADQIRRVNEYNKKQGRTSRKIPTDKELRDKMDIMQYYEILLKDYPSSRYADLVWDSRFGRGNIEPKDLEMARKFSERSNNLPNRCQTLMNIGNALSRTQENYDEALNYYTRALDCMDSPRLKDGINRSIAFIKKKQKKH